MRISKIYLPEFMIFIYWMGTSGNKPIITTEIAKNMNVITSTGYYIKKTLLKEKMIKKVLKKNANKRIHPIMLTEKGIEIYKGVKQIVDVLGLNVDEMKVYYRRENARYK